MKDYNGNNLCVRDKVCVISNTQLSRALGPWNTEGVVKIINEKEYIDFNRVFVIPSKVIATQVLKMGKGN